MSAQSDAHTTALLVCMAGVLDGPKKDFTASNVQHEKCRRLPINSKRLPPLVVEEHPLGTL